ncbi:hypothetical protein AB685_12250 [Bacillus sp. LL01]|uniref:flagellar hook-length control protein FliK n=1 Tax=Bacillus sp. LL01 TaxID=1665556 RepID=UPI00064D4E86|nr:flagellar hook-length control protein FliK [Bacillus sp. LL01]KMJ58641.1 hypothetical protein AB685_12250 [Bacillus sp. LL01]
MKKVNFFVTGEAHVSHAGQVMKTDGNGKKDQIPQETSESFRSALSNSLVALLSLHSQEKVGSAEGEAMSIVHSVETQLQEMDEILSMQLSMLNDLQEMEELPEGYYGLLEDVMAMVTLLADFTQPVQEKTEQLIKPFQQLSERVMVFMQAYFGEKENRVEKPLANKEHSNLNLKELMSMIEKKLEKMIPVEHTRTNLNMENGTTRLSVNVPAIEPVLHNGPVTMNMLQLPKQATIQWVIDTTSNEAAREQLMQKLEGILAKTSARLVNGNQSMTIRLAPEHLGTLHIKLQETQHGLVTKLIVHSKAAASLLESGLGALKQTLVQANVNMDKIEVVFQDQDQKFTQQHKGTNEEDGHPEQSFKQYKNNEDDKQSFEDVLLEEMEINSTVGEIT